MPADARDVATLVEDDDELADAIRSVLDAAEDGVLQWEDVESEVTSGQWGRLIQHEIVSPADGDDFSVGDRSTIERGLNGDADQLADEEHDESTVDEDGTATEEPAVDEEDGGDDGDDTEADTDASAEDVDLSFDDIPEVEDDVNWTQWDKLAALGSVSLIVGYWFDPVQNAVGGTIDLFIGPIHDVLPFWGVIFLLATLTGTYATLLMSNMMDMDTMGQYQERMKAIQDKQEEVKESGDDELEEEFREKQMEMMGDQLGMFKSQFRPMVWIMLLTIPIFLWLWWQVDTHVGEQGMVMPIAGGISWDQGIGGPFRAWIVWYMLVTISFRQLISKALHMKTSPMSS